MVSLDPRFLKTHGYSKTRLIDPLHLCVRRDGTSWGFSIVGGAEPGSERTEPVHVLFVVPESPAAKVQSSVELQYNI